MDWNIVVESASPSKNPLSSPVEFTKSHIKFSIGLVISFCVTLAACGGGSYSTVSQNAQISGNWEFSTLSPGSSFTGGLQGGFLTEQNGSISGQVVYSVSISAITGPCDSGTATVTGTVSGQNVTLNAVGGNPQTGLGETFALTGSLSTNSSGNPMLTISSYAYAPAAPTGGTPCGNQETISPGGTIFSVPTLTGGFQGFFHSEDAAFTGSISPNQDFAVSGTLTQGENIGASSATVTGTIVFQDPATLLTDYPCVSTASVNGTISGNTVVLQLFASTGAVVGDIGQAPGTANLGAVTFDSTTGGYVLHNSPGGAGDFGYSVTTKACPLGDTGDLCLAFGKATACTQPITLSPFSLTFAPQLLGSTTTTETISIATSSTTPSGGITLNLSLDEIDGNEIYTVGGGDFNGASHFAVVPTGQANDCTTLAQYTLAPFKENNLALGGQNPSSCLLTVSFSPQESCPWLPVPPSGASVGIQGLPPVQCPVSLNASLNVISSLSADPNITQFSVPITGTGMSFVVPSTPELDFGSQAVGEVSPSQALTFTNQGPYPVQVLTQGPPCTYSKVAPALARPPDATVGGLELAETALNGLENSQLIAPAALVADTVQFYCDIDPPPSAGGNLQSNFVITDSSSNPCQGTLLQPQQSCDLQVTFEPQPATWRFATKAERGLDDFLELNTQWCEPEVNPVPGPSNPCEIDSGRFPVEIKTNPPSPLRMTPAAGLNFGLVTENRPSSLTITLFNDPVDPNTGTVNVVSKVSSSSDFVETDSCPSSLAPNASCTLTFTFTPSKTVFETGVFTLTYNLVTSSGTQSGLIQTVWMRGTGQ